MTNPKPTQSPTDLLIIEGIVTTMDAQAGVNIAPMGPLVSPDGDWHHLVLRPFRSSTTYRNLREGGQGVFHVTDDVWLLAQAAVGPVEPAPPMFPAQEVEGQVLASACRWYEFRVHRLDDSLDRTTIDCSVIHAGRLRDFIGFNRAKHAVVEAAILATRIGLMPVADVLAEFQRLSVLVKKTGGSAEHRAFDFLLQYVTSKGPMKETTKDTMNTK